MSRSGPRSENPSALDARMGGSSLNLDDLISDAELADKSEDKFGHRTIVEQLESVVRSRDKDRAINIGLYGPWGSGKSSVAAQLEAAFEADEAIKFIRFDAFKYSQHSLHRHFLAEMARALPSGKEAAKRRHWRPEWWKRRWPRKAADYRDRLYQSTQRKSLTISTADGLRLIWTVIKLVLVPTVLAAIAGAALWARVFAAEHTLASFKAALPGTLTLLAVPAAAALFAVVREILPVSTAIAEPSSAEQFELMFAELVGASGMERVVVFVDEIDRCSPNEVVETLDTVRTFLGVPPCVFIVAADQRVLEQAISIQVRQVTPDDTTNPYYSAGSAYLDKVFQYQFSLPPLLPATVSQYSRELVESLPGVWSRINKDDVISLLIATHVRSPRRVKALLNNYVLTYRLAQEAGIIGPETEAGSQRDEELAVLVCLQSEFPKFYRDLARHPRLPALLRAIHNQRVADEEPTPPEGTPAASWTLALAYANGEVVGDQILATRTDIEGQRGGPESGAKLNTELTDYLQKTSHVPGPGTDLVFMVTSEAYFGLDPTEAEELSAAAFNRSAQVVLDRMEGFTPEQRDGLLLFLAHRTRELAFGSEGSNMASTLLAAAGRHLTESGGPADAVARAISAQQTKRALADADMPGALRVGMLSSAGEAAELVARVIELGRHRFRPEITEAILANAEPLAERDHWADIAQAWAWGVVQDGVRVERVAGALAKGELRELALEAQDTLVEILRKLEAGECGTTTEDAEPDQQAALHARLVAVLAALNEAGATEAAELLMCALYQTSVEPLVGLVRDQLASTGPALTASFVDVMKEACGHRPLDELATWFNAAHGPGLTDPKRQQLHEQVLMRLWSERSAYEEPAFETALTALGAKRHEDLAPVTDVRQLLEGAFSSLHLQPASLAEIDTEFRRLARFDEAGLVPGAAAVFAEALCALLCADPPAVRPARPDPTLDYARQMEPWLEWAASRISSDDAQRIVAELQGSPWFPWQRRERIAFEVAVQSDLKVPRTAEELREHLSLDPADADVAEILRIWVTKFDPSPGDVWEVFGSHAWAALTPELAGVLKAYASSATPAVIAKLTEPMVLSLPEKSVNAAFLLACDYPRAEPGTACAALTAAATKAVAKPDHRRRVLDAWLCLGPSEAATRAALIDKIAVPFAKQAEVAAELILSSKYGALVENPPAASREGLRKAIESKFAGKQSAKRIERRLQELNIKDTPVPEQIRDRAVNVLKRFTGR